MQDGIVDFEFRREALGLHRKRGARLRPRDARFQPCNGFPAIIAGTESGWLPENGLPRVIESRWRDPNHGKRDSIKSDRGPQNFRVTSEELLPQSVTDH